MRLMKRKLAGPLAALVTGASLALGAAACGDEEREGGVQVEGGGTGTVGTGTAPSTAPAPADEAPPGTTTAP